MASDTLQSLGQELVQGNNVYVSVHPASKEEADSTFNAVSEGRDRDANEQGVEDDRSRS